MVHVLLDERPKQNIKSHQRCSEYVVPFILIEAVQSDMPYTVSARAFIVEEIQYRSINPHVERLVSQSTPLEVTVKPSNAPDTRLEVPFHLLPILKRRQWDDFLIRPRLAVHLDG